MIRLWIAVAMIFALALDAHEGGKKNRKATKAQADLNQAKKKLNSAKGRLAKQGRYSCCVKPSCDLCARVNGSCACARNVAAGKGACGECYAGWIAGRGAIRGVKAKQVPLLTAEHQSCPLPGGAKEDETISRELREAADALLRGKRTLVTEKRFGCCVKGGCGQCAHEADCPCGGDLASGKKGICGDCLDRWRAGEGAFPGIEATEATLAPMGESMMEGMGPGGAPSSGWYGSGTSQVPQTALFDMLQARIRGWSVMASGQMFGVYSTQSGPRGREKLFSTNWLMGMASRRVGPGTLTLRSMISLEPATITSRRYPLLFATGETSYGIPIINGQHPHQFLMELAALYQIRLGERTSLALYGGPRGEPALGPPAFPHRISGSENPVAVLSHHLQDSTHISTNVATAGITHGPLTWEVSGFHGREPGEQRWGLQNGAIDSLSTRLTITPTTRWSGQFSIGRLNQREAIHPLRPALRTTASVHYARPVTNGRWATSAVWGRNHDLAYTQLPNVTPLPPVFGPRLIQTLSFIRPPLTPQHIVSVPTRIPGQIYNSFLVESTLERGANWFWGRVESTDKDSTLLYEEEPFVLLVDELRYTRVQAFTMGYERELPGGLRWLKTGIGGQFTWYRVPANLAAVYGQHPVGIQLFVRLRLGRK